MARIKRKPRARAEARLAADPSLSGDGGGDVAGNSLLGGSEEQEMRLQGSLWPCCFLCVDREPYSVPGVGVGGWGQEPCSSADLAVSKPTESPSPLLNAALPFCILVGWLGLHPSLAAGLSLFHGQRGLTVLCPGAGGLPGLQPRHDPVRKPPLADLNTRMEKKVKIDNFRPTSW